MKSIIFSLLTIFLFLPFVWAKPPANLKTTEKTEKNKPAAYRVLFNFNAGRGKSWPGWTWSDDVSYGNPGWTWDKGPVFKDTGWPVRCFAKSGHGNDCTGKIDPAVRAPSTKTGGSLYVKNVENTGKPSSKNRAAWWVLHSSLPLSSEEMGQVTDSTTDRLSFYIKIYDTPKLKDDGGPNSIPSNNFHVGTYTCWEQYCAQTHSGESPNGHWYFYYTFSPGGWIHALMDQHPTHRRESSGPYITGNNPTFTEHGKHLFEYMNRLYFETTSKPETAASYHLDELKWYSTADTVEPDQNEESVTSLWVGYWPDADHWEMGWQDMSFVNEKGRHFGNYTHSTFEIRWSTDPITNENFANANPITPLLYGGTKYTRGERYVRRVRPHGPHAWTRFKLPDDIEASYDRLYFAVKDISGGEGGTKWPYNRPDGHNAPTERIKTIDYHLRPQ